MKCPSCASLPPIARGQLGWFFRYVRFYLRRNFHGIHLLKLSSEEEFDGWPLLVCVNHPSWWDPLMGLYLSQRLFPARTHYASIAAAGVAKHRFFERLGFFGIDPHSAAGARRFLRTGEAVLNRADGAFWVTPQGRFTDVRTRPVQLQAGAGHLARRARRFAMLPVAFEYAFWNERTPEAFACLGRPVFIDSEVQRTPEHWNEVFSGALEAAQDALSEQVARRDPTAFEPLLEGRAGVGGVYDLWRGLSYRLRGKKFEAEHGRV